MTTKYTYTAPLPKWYDKIIPKFVWNLFYRLKFDLYTVHTGRFKMWKVMHDHINNQL